MRTVENPSPEWERIKVDFIAGAQSIRGLARFYHLSDTAIRKRAKAEGWVRNTATKPEREPKRASSRELVVQPMLERESEPEMVSRIITKAAAADHGELVKESRAILELLTAELRSETVNIAWLEEVIAQDTKSDESPRRQQALKKAISLPVRIMAAKNLALAVKTLEDTGLGKKEQAHEDAKTAGAGTTWGDDLNIADFGTN